MPRGYLSQAGTADDDDVFHQTRATLGALNWLAARTRPNLAVVCSIIPGYSDRDRKMVSEANAAVKQAEDVCYHTAVWPIPPVEWAPSR